MLVIVIKPLECLRLQLFCLLTRGHTRQELWRNVKRDDRVPWVSTEVSSLAGMLVQVQNNNGLCEELGREGQHRPPCFLSCLGKGSTRTAEEL